MSKINVFKGNNMTLNHELKDYVSKASSLVSALPSDRTEKLSVLVDYMLKQKETDSPITLNFICTHNSRRSHLGQLWGAVAAHVHGVEGVTTFSGGTEATAFNPRAVAAIERAGFKVTNPGGDNPHYRVSYSDSAPEAICFSKRYDHETNPTNNFAAIMTCNDADQNCPMIHGAKRISLPYRDPKEADDTAQEMERYDERCLQLAVEMLWAFDQLVKRTASFAADKGCPVRLRQFVDRGLSTKRKTRLAFAERVFL